MKSVLAAIIGLALTTWAIPAMAYVVQISTSIDVTEVSDKAQLREAIESAVEDVVNHAIAFSPTVVMLQNARVVGDRMYLLLLIADADGEKTLQVMSAEGLVPSDPDGAEESWE